MFLGRLERSKLRPALRHLGVKPAPDGQHRSDCLRDFAPGGLFSIEISRNAKRREGSVFESHFEKYPARAMNDVGEWGGGCWGWVLKRLGGLTALAAGGG